jgi:methylase of polypeptide subunit release factors
MFMNVMGKYCPRLEAILTDNDTEEKAVLDLGCGSGAWYASISSFNRGIDFSTLVARIMDVARDFPHVSCVAVDLVPLQSP